MADWEEEADTIETTTQLSTDKNSKEQESEEIIKPKVEYKPPAQVKENPDDYEKKWQAKNKDLLDRRAKEEKALEGLDEQTKQKKLIDMRNISDASDFIGGEKGTAKKESDKEAVLGPLVTEKDFTDLAVQSVSRIKAANKPSKFTFSYLKTNLDLLVPTLDGEKLDQLIKDLNVHFNKKRKE